MHSAHFSEAELECHCGCGQNGCQQALIDGLEGFRMLVGGPVIVDDAYRCPTHNAAVGGVPKSQHELGLAADVRVEGKMARDLDPLARQISNLGGLGVDDHQQYIHIDFRASGALAQWCYNTAGKQEPYYEAAA